MNNGIVMDLHNDDLVIYPHGIFNTKTQEWIALYIKINHDGYQSICLNLPNNKLKNGEISHCVFSKLLGCYYIDRQLYLDGIKVDHIDQNSLNNNLSNLRYATDLQQVLNRGKNKNNTSGFEGVTKKGKKWQARIGRNRNNLGIFESKSEAVVAYRKEHIAKYGVDSKYYPDQYKIQQSELNIRKKIRMIKKNNIN
jgi:hypothetical protein